MSYAECYHDAERILRGHLLPCQLRDVSFIEDPPKNTILPPWFRTVGEEGLQDVAQRHLGAFGLPAPYGHRPIGIERFSFNMDIVGGAVASLCETYREVTRFDQTGHHVNLLFDHETETVKVQSPYTHDALAITVFPLLEQEIALKHSTRTIHVRLRGAEVIAMENFGADLMYFNCLD